MEKDDENDNDIKEEPMEVDEAKMDISTNHEETPMSADLINVSEGFHLRTFYKRKVKTSKLDGLLERRVKQFTLEEKQRLERLKSKASTTSSDCKLLSPQKNVDDLQITKAADGKQMDLTSPNGTHISDTNSTEDLIQDRLSSTSLCVTKTSETVQSMPCLNRLLEEETGVASVQHPDTQSSLVKHTNESKSELIDTDKIQARSQGIEIDNSIVKDDKPIESKETNEYDILKDTAKSSEQINATEAQYENVHPMLSEGIYKGDVSSAEEGHEALKSGKQDCDSIATCSLEGHSDVQTNDVKEGTQENSEDTSENKILSNQKQTLGKLKPVHPELISEKAYEAQIPDMIGAEIIDEVVKSKIAETNGEKQDQEKFVPPSSLNKCFDQLKSIADKNNNKNGELDTGTEKEKSKTFQINGKDADFKVLSNEQCLKRESVAQRESNIDAIVNNINKSNPLMKPFSSNLPVKPFMNGDIAMEDTDEKNNMDTVLCAQNAMDFEAGSGENVSPQDNASQFAQNVGKKQQSPEKISPINNTPIPALQSCNENSIYNETESTEIEPPCVKKTALSPIISGEESSLSNDFADQNGLQTYSKVENTSEENEVKAVVTEVTTTSTVSTESKTIYKVSQLTATKDDKESMVSSSENCSIATVTTTTTTTVTKLTSPPADSDADVISVKEHSKTVVTTTVMDSLTIPGGTLVTSMTVSKEYSTRDKVKLMKFSRPKKTRSGTALPSYRKFVTKSSKKSIFVLPNDDLKKLARKGGIREVPCFNYTAKPALDIWPYPSPRPTFGITWRYIANYFF